tara:strand:+ start:381 stop:662 length:282 start_codon:yes stop_codon:yes gene_type:complete
MNTSTEENKPFVTIDGVQVYAEDLSSEGQIYLARLQRLNNKKAIAIVDLEELNASIAFFESRLIVDYQGDMNDEESTEESTSLENEEEETTEK